MNRKPTLTDVAATAGVSPKTVSRVIHEERYVAPDTANRVREAIELLGFRPNMIAQSLRLGSAPPSIGLVIEDLANPFYSVIARAVEIVARRHGYMMIVGSSEEDPERERQLVGALLRRQVSGAIVVPSGGGDHSYLEPELKAGTPIVFLDRPPRRLEAADTVLLDDVGGARAGVTYLLEQGHRRIGLVGDAESMYTARKRASGYRRALSTWGAVRDPQLERLGTHTVEAAETSAADLLALPEPPTAIFATNNRNCIGVLRAVSRSRANVEVVGFDEFDLADLISMPLTIVSYDAAELGTTAAELLFGRLANGGSPPRRIRISTRLVTHRQRAAEASAAVS
jgi:LacI family transcriptional regulator